MAKEVTVAEWLKALRSDKYTQGSGHLHDLETNAFCCLGVGCDLAEVDWMPVTYGATSAVTPYGEDACIATGTFNVYGEWGHFVMSYTYDGEIVQDLLIRMNDSDSYSFTDIAEEAQEMAQALGYEVV